MFYYLNIEVSIKMHRPQNPPAAALHVASNPHCRIGENPLWHPTHRKLYWCDIPFGRLYAFDPETRATELLRDGADDGTLIGGFTIQHDGALLLFMRNGRIDRWTAASSQTLIAPRPDHAGMRFNDVIADPAGRVFCGTMPFAEPLDGTRPGNLYRLDHDATLTPVLTNVLCSNGLAFTRDARHLFHTDSLRRTITRFDYDLATGTLSRPVPFITTHEQDGLPDGLTIDAEDHLWSAHWGGHCIIRYTPDGREQSRIALPTSRVSSLTFGGDDLCTLFITTATEEPPATHVLDGALFMTHLSTQGAPEFPSRIAPEFASTS